MSKSTLAPASTYVDLDRRFQSMSETDAEQLEVLDMFPEYRSGLKWTDILLKRRVVILAEAGSGKSRELEHQAIKLREQGKIAFLAALEDVGKIGLEQALLAGHEAFIAWKTSDQEAWFFLDSIDEAKKARVRLNKALERIANDLKGCEARSHIVLSGRQSDWDFKSDLSSVDILLEIPRELTPAEIPDVAKDQLVSQISDMEDEDVTERSPEKTAVLVMLPLDEPRVRTFAINQGISGVDTFLSALKANDLMGLARRPLDLRWLSDHWRAKGEFGRLSQMLELSLVKLATEVRSSAPVHASLSASEALMALDRVGAALVLQKLELVLIPDEGVVVQPHCRDGIVLSHLLGNLSAKQIAELLGRPVFIPVMDGIVRLAQDNKGAVRSLLAARWLRGRIRANCPRREIRNLLFATVYGEQVVIPSMQQTAAWLSIWDEDTGLEVAARDPLILIQLGDPASLSDVIAVTAIRSLVARLVNGDHDRVSDFDQIRRLMRPAFVPTIRELWTQHKGVRDVRTLLVKCIHHGRLSSLVDLAFEAATEFHVDVLCTVFGGRAVLELAQPSVINAYIAHVCVHFASLPATIVWEVAEAAFPSDLSADDVVAFLATLRERHSEMYFERFLRAIEAKPIPIPSLLRILGGLVDGLPDDEEAARYGQDGLVESVTKLSEAIYSKLGADAPPEILIRAFFRVNKYERARQKDNVLHNLAVLVST